MRDGSLKMTGRGLAEPDELRVDGDGMGPVERPCETRDVDRGRVLVAAVACIAFVAILVAAAFHVARSYDPAQVAVALRAQGLDVREVRPDGYAGPAAGGAVLMPRDAAFTVIVYGTDDQARDALRQYETTIADAETFDTFELRSGNVLVLADFSNADQPLPSETRDRIRRAVTALEAK